MKNAVGREIPDYLLKDGKEVYQGKNYMDASARRGTFTSGPCSA